MPPKNSESTNHRKAKTSSSVKSAITGKTDNSGSTRKSAARKRKSRNTAPLPLPFSSGDPRNKYVYTDTSMFDIEELAQRQMKYHCIATDEAIYLSTDPVRRDQCLDAHSKNPKVVDTKDAETVIGDLNALDYLAWVDGELEKIPATFEDHLLRANFAWAGALVFNEYVKCYGLTLFPKARSALSHRTTQLTKEYVKGLKQNTSSSGSTHIDTHPSPPSRSTSTGSNLSAPTSSTSSTTSSSSRSHVTPQQADEWMSNVLQSDLTHLRFKFLSATGIESPNDPAGIWSLKGVEMRNRKPTYQTTWTFPDGNSCLIPYDAQSFRALLINSEVVGEIVEEDTDVE
ncbi:hypothetical protein C8Q75DRAFT_895926 [Abortiporus biennis]|nr:hypothetical protein C8Q75DRAFT_895926 [Abortiporus biennis]